ncbi:28S ribosomal protein S18c, mitochondrial [Ooceraea biroi]|nr:28S ribosomal protein S18c, mitochondrial [Ooceraea biroi]
MISISVLEKVRTTLVTSVLRPYLRTIRNSSTDNTVEVNAKEKDDGIDNAVEVNVEEEDDMPIEFKKLGTLKHVYKKEQRKCILCELNIEPDYKNVRLLSQFQSRHTGRIYGKHITGLCEHKQKRVEQEIIKAQNSCLMGYWTKEPEYVDDPQLFDPNHPFRPHKY